MSLESLGLETAAPEIKENVPPKQITKLTNRATRLGELLASSTQWENGKAKAKELKYLLQNSKVACDLAKECRAR